jgi:hypothetical protein
MALLYPGHCLKAREIPLLIPIPVYISCGDARSPRDKAVKNQQHGKDQERAAQ